MHRAAVGLTLALTAGVAHGAPAAPAAPAAKAPVAPAAPAAQAPAAQAPTAKVWPRVASASAISATPITLDAALCLRDDKLSVAVPPQPAHYTRVSDDEVTACSDALDVDCHKLKVGPMVEQTEGGPPDVAINPAGTQLMVGGNADDWKLRIVRVKDGAITAKIINKRNPHNSCGPGIWLADTVLAFGQDCEEYDASPFFADARTGRYIAPFAKLSLTAAARYAALQLGPRRWAVSVYEPNSEHVPVSFGWVAVVDPTTGHLLFSAVGNGHGGAVVTEGKTTRKYDAVPTCPGPSGD